MRRSPQSSCNRRHNCLASQLYTPESNDIQPLSTRQHTEKTQKTRSKKNGNPAQKLDLKNLQDEKFFHWSTLIGTLVLSAHQPAALSQATPNNSFTIDYQGTTYKVDTYGAGKTYQDTKNLIGPLNFKSSIIWNDAILA